jgi:hypothetical protein
VPLVPAMNRWPSVSRPLRGLRSCFRRDPTDKSVGYYHSSAARTTFSMPLVPAMNRWPSVSRPLHGLRSCFRRDPTDKSVGYYHSSAARTGQNIIGYHVLLPLAQSLPPALRTLQDFLCWWSWGSASNLISPQIHRWDRAENKTAVRPGGRLTIAQRFIAGITPKQDGSPPRRTTDNSPSDSSLGSHRKQDRSPRSGRLTIAQRFIAGIAPKQDRSPPRRTTERVDVWPPPSSVRFTDYISFARRPSDESLGYCQSPAIAGWWCGFPLGCGQCRASQSEYQRRSICHNCPRLFFVSRISARSRATTARR